MMLHLNGGVCTKRGGAEQHRSSSSFRSSARRTRTTTCKSKRSFRNDTASFTSKSLQVGDRNRFGDGDGEEVLVIPTVSIKSTAREIIPIDRSRSRRSKSGVLTSESLASENRIEDGRLSTRLGTSPSPSNHTNTDTAGTIRRRLVSSVGDRDRGTERESISIPTPSSSGRAAPPGGFVSNHLFGVVLAALCTAAITFQLTNRGLKEVVQVPKRLRRLFLQKEEELQEEEEEKQIDNVWSSQMKGNKDWDRDGARHDGGEGGDAPKDWDDIEKIDEKVLVERLYKKLVAAKELHERQQVENNERLAYARSEMKYMQDELSASKRRAKSLERKFHTAEETLKERERELEAKSGPQVVERAGNTNHKREEELQGERNRLQEDLRAAKEALQERDQDLANLKSALEERDKQLADEQARSSKAHEEGGQIVRSDGAELLNHSHLTQQSEGDLALQIQGAVNEMRAEHETECEKYINGNFKAQADLLSSLQSKTDLIYEQMNDLLQIEREIIREDQESAEERRVHSNSDSLSDESAVEEKLQADAAKLTSTLDVALWTQEIADLRQINATLHDLLQGSQRTYTQQVSHLYFKMLSLRYALVVHEIQNEAKKKKAEAEAEVNDGRRGGEAEKRTKNDGGDGESGSKEELLHL